MAINKYSVAELHVEKELPSWMKKEHESKPESNDVKAKDDSNLNEEADSEEN